MKTKFFLFLLIFLFFTTNTALAYFFQDSKVVTVGNVIVDKKIYDENEGRAIRLHIHGEGVYHNRQKIYSDSEEMKYEEDMVASKEGNVSWTNDLCLKNYGMYSAVRERYTKAEFVEKDTIALMNKNETLVEIHSSFQGMGYFALRTLKPIHVDAYDYYIGSFTFNKFVHLKMAEADLECP